MHRPVAMIATACALLSCAPSDKPATAGADSTASSSSVQRSGEGDLKDVQNYHLTMDNVNKWYAAQRNIALKVRSMTPAEREGFDAGGSDGDLDATVAKIEGNKTMSAALSDAGLSAREYALMSLSMIQSSMAAGMLKMRPNDNQDSLVRAMKANMDNVKFMQQHQAELTATQQKMEAEMGRTGASDGQ